jgi:2-phosphoglycerate kinase
MVVAVQRISWTLGKRSMPSSFASLSSVDFHSSARASLARPFLWSPKVDDTPKLILIGGCTGTGKSTFGMSVALDQDILRCISTDTVRAVMRSFIAPDISPALHRSSYTPAFEGDDPVGSWRETCSVLEKSVEGLVDDAIRRGVSLVVEGVHVVPGNKLIQRWEDSGGIAMGCLLTIKDADAHKALLYRRGEITRKGEKKKIQAFDRVRVIQEGMIQLAEEANWLLIEQKLEPDPLEMVAAQLYGHAELVEPMLEEALSAKPVENDSREKDGPSVSG